MISNNTKIMSHGLSLRVNFSWTFFGNAIYAASQWGMVIVLTKLGSPEMVGQFALSLAITAPIIMFASLQLRGVQATDANKQFEFGHYYGLRLITASLALLTIIFLVFLSEYQRETVLVILVMGIAKSIESISDIFYGLMQQHERMDWIAKSMMIKGPLSLLALGSIVYFTGSLVWGVMGIAIAWTLVLIGFDYKNGLRMTKELLLIHEPGEGETKPTVRIRPQWEWESLIKLTKLALPLGIVMVLVSINANLPRYFIENYWGSGELGIFAAVAYLMVVGGIMVAALAQASSPRLAQYYAAGHFHAFKKLLLRLIIIGFVVGVAGVLVAVIFGSELLAIIYQPEYARQDIFVILMIAAALGYIGSFLGYAITAARYFLIQIPLFGLVTLTTALVGFWLIPENGLLGAAAAVLSGTIVQVVFSCFVIGYALYANQPRRNHGVSSI